MTMVASGDLQTPPRSDLRAVRANRLRTCSSPKPRSALPVFRHPGRQGRDRQTAPLRRAVPGTHAHRWRLRARQGATDHRAFCAKPAGTGRSFCTAPCSACAISIRNSASISARFPRQRSPKATRRVSLARSSSRRLQLCRNAGARRFAEPLDCFASGWMSVRQRAKQRGVELPLVISDHADWDELTATISELRPQELWITHGRDDALARWAELEGLDARRLDPCRL